MNLRRIRLVLTTWYVVVLLAIVVAMGTAAYVALNRALASEVDRSLESSAARLADQLREQPAPTAPTPVSGERQRGRDDDHGDDDEGHELEYLTGSSGDVFYAVLSPEGTTLANPLNVDFSRLGGADGIEEARLEGKAWRTVKAGEGEYRLLFYAVVRDGTTISIVEAGRSLKAHHNDLNNLAIVLVITSAGGLAFAVVGGLYVSGRALRPASEAYEKQREFVSDASHELRTPLTLIRASAEAIQRSRKSTIASEDAEAIGDILSESDRMSTLVDDLLTLAKLDEKRLPLRRQSFDLSVLLQEVGRWARTFARGRDVTIRVDTPVQLNTYADLEAVQRVVRILVDNAVRYAGEGGVIQISGRAVDGWAEVAVSDSGPGLQPEDLKHVFERFYRVDASRSKDTGGSGLGLSIARGIVEAHGGRISVESKPGSGATFKFTLPRQP